MNIYEISIASQEAQHHRNVLGYSAALNEYAALKAFGFFGLTLRDYGAAIYGRKGKDEWTYTADNAVSCMVYAQRAF